MICRLSNAFVKRGIDVSILVISDCNQTYELDKCVEVLYSGRGIRSKAVRMLQALKMIRSFLKKKSVDILLCFIITTIPFAVLSGIGLKKEYKIIGAERSNPKVMNPRYKKIVEIFSGNLISIHKIIHKKTLSNIILFFTNPYKSQALINLYRRIIFVYIQHN